MALLLLRFDRRADAAHQHQPNQSSRKKMSAVPFAGVGKPFQKHAERHAARRVIALEHEQMRLRLEQHTRAGACRRKGGVSADSL